MPNETTMAVVPPAKSAEQIERETIADTLSKLPPIFAACVSQTEVRFETHKPFNLGGFTYATNGRICVRLPGERGMTIDRPPPAEKLDDWRNERGPFIAVTRDMIPLIECPACLGTCEKKRVKCPRCGGEGEIYCDLGFDHRCPRCKGSCWTLAPVQGGACLHCAAAGKIVAGGVAVDLGPVRIQDIYAAILVAHGVAVVWPAANNTARRPVRFAIGEVEGLLMPYNPPPAVAP